MLAFLRFKNIIVLHKLWVQPTNRWKITAEHRYNTILC